MQDGEDHNGIRAHKAEDAVGETPCQDATDFRLPAHAHLGERMFQSTLDGRADFQGKFQPQTLHPLLIPDGGLSHVRLGLRPDDEAVLHDLSRARMRASTSSHELPASGSFS